MKRLFPGYISFILLIFFPFLTNAQAGKKSDEPYHLTVEKGGNIQFKVNTFHYYIEGVDYSDWTNTSLKIYCDALSTGEVWYIGAIAYDSEFLSSFPDQSLPLDYVKLKAEDGGSDWTSTGEKTLDHNSYIRLVEGGKDNGSYRLDIEYRLDSTLGRHPGYYNTNIEFRVDTTKPSTWELPW